MVTLLCIITIAIALAIPLWKTSNDNWKLSSELMHSKAELFELQQRVKICNELRDGVNKINEDRILELQAKLKEMENILIIYQNNI